MQLFVTALTVLCLRVGQQPDGRESDSSPCTLTSGDLASAWAELVRWHGSPELELKAVRARAGKALEEHRRIHGWPASIEHRILPSGCPAMSLEPLQRIGVQLASIGRTWEVERIAEILERNGRSASALELLSFVPMVRDGVTVPSGPISEWKPALIHPCEQTMASIERRRGHWQSALDHYTEWRAISSCGTGAMKLAQRGDMNRLECLAALGRWEEYRDICRDQIRRDGLAFTTHLIESYRVGGAPLLAERDLERILQSREVPLVRNEAMRARLEKEQADHVRRVRERARLHFRFLELEEAEELGELPTLFRSGLPFDVALQGVQRLGSRGVTPVISALDREWSDPEMRTKLLQLLALTGDPTARSFLTSKKETDDPYVARDLSYWLTVLDLVQHGVDVRRTSDKGLYLPE